MAVIEIYCVGRCWQDDFTPLVPRLYTYFSRCFWEEPDYEELRHKAVLRFMHRLMRMWSPGKTVRIATCFIVWHVRAGRDVLPLPDRHHRSVRTCWMSPRVERRAGFQIDIAQRLDLKLALERMSGRDRAIISHLRAAYTWREVKERLGTTDHHIMSAIRRLRAKLSA